MKFYKYLSFLFASPFIFAQGDCPDPEGYAELNINNVRTGVATANRLWWDGSGGPNYVVPNLPDESPSALLTGSYWIGGYDDMGQLRVSASTYRQSGNDFFPGPLDENGEVDESSCMNFDRLWEVKGHDIEVFLDIVGQAGGDCPEVEVSQIPLSLLQWPEKTIRISLSLICLRIKILRLSSIATETISMIRRGETIRS